MNARSGVLPRVRGFVGDADVHHLRQLTNDCLEADGVEHTQSYESIANTYRRTRVFDPRQDVFFAEASGHPGPVGFVRVRWMRQPDGSPLYDHLGYVLPQWRRRGIGATLMGHAQRRLRAIAAEQRAEGDSAGGERQLQSFAYDGENGARALLAAAGYRPVPELEMQNMVRSTLEPPPYTPLPDGLEVRPFRPEHRRLIWAALQDAHSDDPGFAQGGDEDSYRRWVQWPFWDERLWRVAWDGDQVAGMVLNFIRPEENVRFGRLRGYTEWINVARSWRRRGVARALIGQSLLALRERGMHEAALDVFVHNATGARLLYESLGYRRLRSLHYYRAPLAP